LKNNRILLLTAEHYSVKFHQNYVNPAAKDNMGKKDLVQKHSLNRPCFGPFELPRAPIIVKISRYTSFIKY
jgi:hypothetical protein